MRRYGVQGAYEQLKAVTRGKTIGAQDLHQLIQALDIPPDAKQRLLDMTPASYTGWAAQLARRV
jgi:adenylosuccinate lyase